MIWVTWRQHRLQLLAGTGVLAILLAFLLPTGMGIWSTFRSTGLASVTRARWARTKIAVFLAARIAGAAILTWVLAWWSRPFVASSSDRFQPNVFDLRGIVPVAYALFALARGIAAGTVVRRVVPAMATALVGYAAVRIVVDPWVRPHYAAAESIAYSFFGSGYPRARFGDWVLSTKTVDRAGRLLSRGETLDFNVLSRYCPSLPRPPAFPGKGAIEACVNRAGVHVVSTYQPGNRYWTFQGIETAIFVVVAAALLAFSVWFMRRRIA